jgi:SAM-dependent methyltransferase
MSPNGLCGFYNAYYEAVEHSPAHAAFCELAYGRNLCQHGFMTMAQLDALVAVTRPSARTRVLDLGCGNGMIAEYVSDLTGATLTGVDNSPVAIAHARERARAKAQHLNFVVGDLEKLNLPPRSFDRLLSIDSIYFSSDYATTIRGWVECAASAGQIAIYYSCGVDPEHPKGSFSAATLSPSRTPLAQALQQLGLAFETWDFTQDDCMLAQRKKSILERSEADFEREGHRFLYENRLAEALGVIEAVECGLHARYLYHVRL